jgi:CRP-like cAMP-binding protein
MNTTCNCEGCELKGLFFGNFSNDEIESICSRKIERGFQKEESIIREGDEIKDFIYLKSGLVKLFRATSDKREQIISFARPLDFVSLLSIFSEARHNYSVTALEPSVACVLNLEEVKHIAEGNGHFALSVLEKLNRATDRIIITSLELKHRRLFGRIAYMLLYFSDEVYKQNLFELPISRKEMAEYIGLTTENVIRALSDLRRDGIIKISGKEIDIIDKEKLQALRSFS